MSVLRQRLKEIQQRETDRLIEEVAESMGEGTAHSLRNILDRLAKEAETAQTELTTASRLIEDLTPGGSEFAYDIPACVDYIKGRLDGIPKLRKDLAECRKKSAAKR